MSILAVIQQNMQSGNIALQDATRTLTYAEMLAEVRARADMLRAYRCLGMALDNGIDWVLWDLAALDAKIPLVPLPPFFTALQRDHALKSAGCDAMLTPQGIMPLSFEAVELPAGTAKITYTSGTTGTPKGVCLSETAMLQVAQSIIAVLGAGMAGKHCCVLPLAVLLENVAGVYPTLMGGGTVYLPELSEFGMQYAGLHNVLAQCQATSVIFVPEILRLLMAQIAQKGTLPHLRYAAVGGAKTAPSLIIQAQELGLPVYEGYGLSECASVVALNTPDKHQVGTVGRLLPHIQAHLDKGELVVRNTGFLGYIGELAPEEIRTGDIGHIDADDFVSITGRKKNVLITAFGRNVAPEWVEAELTAQPEIAQAIVYGDGAAQLSAFLVPSGSHDIAASVARANARLPDYAQIGSYAVVPEFSTQNNTLTGNGRPRRLQILQLYQRRENMNFYDRLQKETEDARTALYSVPQLVDGLKGDISRDTYIAYLTEAFHHVRHTVRFLMAMGVNLPEDKKWLHDAIAEYIEEEKGHEEWILNDIAAAGGDKEAARNAVPNLETQVLVAYNYDYIARKNPVGFLGMVFMLESTSTQIANNGADAIKKKLGLPQTAFTYLYSHGALDIEHLKFFENLVNKVTDPKDQAAIIEVAQNTFRLFAGVMRAIPHHKVLKYAA